MIDLAKEVLVTGADGMVGSYCDFGIKFGHASLDVTNTQQVEEVFIKYRPKVVVHLAGATDVDRCEREPEYGYMVNGIGTWNVASAAKKIGARVVYVSTVYVFDGSKKGAYDENDRPSPPHYYGLSKYLGEVAVQSLLDDYVILRAGWMFGGGPVRDKKFIAKIVAQLDKSGIKAVNDTIGSLTFANDLVGKIKEIIAVPPLQKSAHTQLPGEKIIHVFNEGVCSRYDIAVEIVKVMKGSTRVTAVDSSYFNVDASRSRNDAMASLYGGMMRPWKAALADYLKTEWTTS